MLTEPNDIIPFHQFHFFTDVIWLDWYGGKKQFAVISLAKSINLNVSDGARSVSSEVKIIHPVSEFIISRYYAREYATMKKHSDNLVGFLNYILRNRKSLNIAAITDLKLSHGTQFLNYLGREKKVSRGTVKLYERTLTNFYVFLSDKELLLEVSKSKFIRKQDQWGRKFYESPFAGVIYPGYKISKKEHAFPLRYFPLLLEIAILEAPRIALGIYLQFFGGLRVGEVVNISRDSAKRRIAYGDFLIKLEKQNFRSDIKDRSGTSVKRKRHQEIYNIKNWLTVLFNDHHLRFVPIDGTNALFVNRDGKAMTAKSYSQYFNRVKKLFCDYLKQYGSAEDIVVSDHLRFSDWSTHIGRGTFTNMIAEQTENPFLVAYKRGDRQLDSSLPYMAKTTRLRQKIEQLFEGLNNEYMPKLVDRRNNGGDSIGQ